MAELKTFFIPEQYDKDELCYAAHAREIIAALEAALGAPSPLGAFQANYEEARREGARAGIEWQRRENGWKEIHATCSDGEVAAALGEVDRG